MTFAGTIGLFLTAMWLFVRILPMVSIAELRTLLPEAHVHEAEEVPMRQICRYGLMAEFDSPQELLDAAQRRIVRATSKWTRSARFRSKVLRMPSDFTKTTCRWLS
jgi:hypothetical protein